MSEGAAKTLAERLGRLSPKGRQYLVLGSLGTLFLGLVFGSIALWDHQPSTVPQATREEHKTRNIATPGAQVDPRDVWMAQSSQQLKEMDEVIQGLKQKLAEVEQKQTVPPPPALPPLPPLPPPMLAAPASSPASSPVAPPLPLPIPKPPGIAAFTVSDMAIQPTVEPEAGKPAKTYIPSGAFMRVALLGGLDAPTGGQAQNNPWPVLLRVQDNAFLPNRTRAKVKECFLLGAAYGDISSERAYLRLETLSCVLDDGEVVDTPAKGYVVGEDGKAGLRGRLVSRQGQVLANALMTGIIAGIGQGFQQNALSYSNTALGSVATPQSGKQFEAGIGAGVGKALDRLSQYYITLAEKMFPIIEVDAGRVVDVVLTKGLTLGLGSAGEDGDYSDLWKRGRQLMHKSFNPQE